MPRLFFGAVVSLDSSDSGSACGTELRASATACPVLQPMPVPAEEQGPSPPFSPLRMSFPVPCFRRQDSFCDTDSVSSLTEPVSVPMCNSPPSPPACPSPLLSPRTEVPPPPNKRRKIIVKAPSLPPQSLTSTSPHVILHTNTNSTDTPPSSPPSTAVNSPNATLQKHDCYFADMTHASALAMRAGPFSMPRPSSDPTQLLSRHSKGQKRAQSTYKLSCSEQPEVCEPHYANDDWLIKNAAIRPYEVLDTELNVDASNWKLIGSGASAVVFQGTLRGKPVAIKVFKTSSPPKYFVNELDHHITLGGSPDVVSLVGYCNGRIHAILMEYCLNGSLFDLLHNNDKEISTRNGRYVRPGEAHVSLSSIVACRTKIAAGIARAMAHVHSHNLCHLDLTSRNVLINSKLEPRLCDFGLSMRMNSNGECNQSPHHGQSYWKAPELTKRRRHCESHGPPEPWSCKVDVFSFGMILWELFNLGQFPWGGELNPEQKIQHGARPDIAKDCPDPWRRLIVACWNHNPNARPSSAEVVHYIVSNHLE